MSGAHHYRQLVEAAFPELAIKTAELDTGGQNNAMLVVNKEWVFRFPLHRQAARELERETAVLQTLQGRLPLPIPFPRYLHLEGPVSQCFSGYRMIQGVPLRNQQLMELDEPGQATVARQLAGFLKALHSLPLVEVLPGAGVGDPVYGWEVLYGRIRKSLFSYMGPASQQKVTGTFQQCLAAAENCSPALVHGDFGPSNILLGPDRRSIAGIIDFSSVHSGDPAGDFSSMIGPFGDGEEFLSRMFPVYPKAREFLQRARYYASTFPLQEALHQLEHGAPEEFHKIMSMYQK